MKKLKLIIVLVLSMIFFFNQTTSVYASSGSTMTSEQVDTLFNGIESITMQLENIGLSDQDISDIFHLKPREEEFYTETSMQTIPYSGKFVNEDSVHNNNIIRYSNQSGNAPGSNQEQRKRIENMYSVALQYYKTNFYEGKKSNGADFGNYLTYLYISHYIDGPGRTPTESDFPFIISSSDVSAYDTFLRTSNLSEWATEMANLGVNLYSDYDYVKSLNAINTVDQTIKDKMQQISILLYDTNETRKAVESIAPIVKNSIVEKYATANSDKELTDETLVYVESQLQKLDFYKNYDKNICNSITSILASTFISAICNSVSLIGIGVSVIPLFVYDYTGLIQGAVLVNLQYSFSGRYAIRIDIYIENM